MTHMIDTEQNSIADTNNCNQHTLYLKDDMQILLIYTQQALRMLNANEPAEKICCVLEKIKNAPIDEMMMPTSVMCCIYDDIYPFRKHLLSHSDNYIRQNLCQALSAFIQCLKWNISKI